MTRPHENVAPNRQQHRRLGGHSIVYLLLAITTIVLCFLAQVGQCSQGCPFDDSSCRQSCEEQKCQLGYCGHFAWIQCICRKCGDEWNWYDQVHYNPDKQVNQTELNSLGLNGTAPLVRGSGKPNESNRSQQQAAGAAGLSINQANNATEQQEPSLIIPDLSDSAKLNDAELPDETDSDKFLDYLANNHDKLVGETPTRPPTSRVLSRSIASQQQKQLGRTVLATS